ncbi:MAG: hypothetical protein KDD52_08575, partial [Bdellovibrionales bacterium]|nr:hypothetical protein [Bdellovibrionales bacterium]
SSEYDQLLNQAQAAFTLDDAKNIYHKAESFLLNEMVAIPLLRDASGILVSPRVKGYPLSPWDICDYASLSVSPIEKNRVQSAS